ncbi:MAG: aminodeoxychorismate synthase component I [Pyrinomonadaceae bacterium]
MQQIDMTADELVSALLGIAGGETVCILDSCGVGHLGSHLLIAGICPVNTVEYSNDDPNVSLAVLEERLSGNNAAIFTLSYDLGYRLLGLGPPANNRSATDEPDIFVSSFDALVIYDYDLGSGWVAGDADKCGAVMAKLRSSRGIVISEPTTPAVEVTSSFTKAEYLAAIDDIRELIRCGDTYQTNLTQQLSAHLQAGNTAENIFSRLRRDHPAPFGAFIRRGGSTVVSASPERFFRVEDSSAISTSPIKGTRPRGTTPDEDAKLRKELLESVKDRAENTMIVDMLRNDLGRVCDYGSVSVETLCELEEHPTLFHLVSTITGQLRRNTSASDVLRALFPCGSITGAPKISTMRIIDRIETRIRGLSMGAIGYYVPGGSFGLPQTLDLSVAIRTMVIRGQIAVFNVGGGIVIDSDPGTEYAESLTKAQALITAIGGRLG